MKEVLLFSSGLDSFITREYLTNRGHKFDCVYFDHGGRYCDVEMEYINNMKFDVTINNSIILGDLEEKSAFIPNRNLLLSIMCNSMGYDKIWIGGSKSDRVCDNNENVFNQLSQYLSTMNKKHIEISSPFWDCYKEDMVDWYQNHAPYNSSYKAIIDLLDTTFSCFDPTDKKYNMGVWIGNTKYEHKTKECQNCSACFRKSAVLSYVGVRRFFHNKNIIKSYKKDFSTILPKTTRSTNTMNYIDWVTHG